MKAAEFIKQSSGTNNISFDQNTTGGLIHQSVATLIARMYPPIEAEPSNIFLGLPLVVWGIIIGCIVIFLLIIASLFFYYYLLPHHKKILSQTTSDIGNLGIVSSSGTVDFGANYLGIPSKDDGDHCIMSQSFFIEKNSTSYQNIMSSSYTMHNPNESKYQIPSCSGHFVNTIEIDVAANSQHNNHHRHPIPETHKSMWAVNTFYDSAQDSNDTQASNYRTRSLPSWGKNGKQRPASTIDDLEELYAQVNFTKKRRNRMRNDNAAIIARCRSRSQNLASLHLENEGVVVYDERTAL